MSFLSVVVTTFNRERVLRATLDCLAKQTLARERFEVIVCDDESPDGTESMVRNYMKDAGFSLRYLRHANRGPGFTENRGISESRGPWVLLIADDIHATPTLLEELYNAHAQNPEPNIAVAGKVIESPQLPKTVFHRHWDVFQYKRFEGLSELPPLHFWGCCISVKREFLLEHGMFIEHPMPAHEDTELGWRLGKNAGLRILYCPEALAHHFHQMDIDTACKQFYSRGYSFDGIADNVTDPELYVLIELITWKTLPHFFRAMSGRLPGYRNGLARIPAIFARHLIRSILFNRVTAPSVFVPIIRAAEHHPFLAKFVSNRVLHWTIAQYFLKGLRALQSKRRNDTVLGPLSV